MKWQAEMQFEDPAPGSYIARIYSLVDLGTHQHGGSHGQPPWSQRDVRISFELPTELMTGKFNPENKGKPFNVHWNGKQSLHANAKLRKLLEGIRGKAFDNDSIAKFDPRNLIGCACRVTLIQSANGQYINIDSASPLAKTDKCPKQVSPGVFFSLERDEFDQAVFEKLGEKTREKIQASPEFAALSQEPSDNNGGNVEPEGGAAEGTDSDIPF